MIAFLYTGALCLNFDNVISLHSTAEQLQIKTAVELCKRYCNDTGVLLPNASSQNVDSAFDKVSSNMDLKDIFALTLLVCQNFVVVVWKYL